ncbi:MAG: ATP-binding protein [Gammaproteobacteria bacterium]|nr:ATP-binding protein [Gammaproteobacteria bacterium]
MKRIQTQYIINDLSKKMVFLVGPRQVGKTYVAKQIAKEFEKSVYLNYDNLEDKKIIEAQSWLESTDLLILDELHKMPAWKNYLKGLYDTKTKQLQILVTGSARLDIFDKIGDSLAGRYFLHRLLPLSPAELHQLGKPVEIETLLTRGGFPEPYLAENDLEANRWRLQYSNSILATDVFEFDQVQNIKALKTIFELLRTKIGSPISYQSLSEDVAISPNTVKKYIEILEALYIIFRITPFSKNIARSLLKEPKIYFFDNGLVKGDEGAQLENLVAVSLLKYVYGKIDYHAEDYTLHYLRNKEGQEVDFALIKDGNIEEIIEVKNTSKEISKSLYAFHKKYAFPASQIVKILRNDRRVENIKVINAATFLSDLTL